MSFSFLQCPLQVKKLIRENSAEYVNQTGNFYFPSKLKTAFGMGLHLANLCQNLFTLRWKSVIAGLCLVRPHVFPFGKNFAKRRNIKDAVVLGWGRQILEKSSQTMGITAATVNACQRYMENDTRRTFNSISRSLIMNGVAFFWSNALT